MNKIKNKPCKKCGGATSIKYIPSSGMDIEPIGMKRICLRCGFSEFIKSLDEEPEYYKKKLEMNAFGKEKINYDN